VFKAGWQRFDENRDCRVTRQQYFASTERERVRRGGTLGWLGLGGFIGGGWWADSDGRGLLCDQARGD
jgi:hypothetical protein